MELATPRTRSIRAGRRLGPRGLIAAGEGNLSIRLDADRLLVTPTGRRKDELEPSTSSSCGSAIRSARRVSASGLAPTSDLAIHLAIHAARPDIGAVAHAHLPASMALTLAGETPDPAALPETAFHLPRLPMVAFGEMGSDDLAARIAAALTEAAGAVRRRRDPRTPRGRWPSASIRTRPSTDWSSSRSCAGRGAMRC